MIKLYVFNIQPYLENDRWKQWLPLLPAKRRSRALSASPQAGARTAAAGWLLGYALSLEDIPREQQIFTENQWGKPMLAHRPSPHFSLSHSGMLVVCALGDSPLGVDVEEPRCTMKIARRFFSPDEVSFLESLSETDRREALNRLWPAKEAFVKALGTGFHTAPDSFAIRLTPSEAHLSQSITRQHFRLAEYRAGQYYICFCTRAQQEEIQYLVLDPQDAPQPKTAQRKASASP